MSKEDQTPRNPLRPDVDELDKAQDKAEQDGKANPHDRPADPADHMDEDEAHGRTMRDLDKRRPE